MSLPILSPSPPSLRCALPGDVPGGCIALLRGGCWRGQAPLEFTRARLPNGVSTTTAAKSTVGSLVTASGHGCGFTPDPSRSVCDSVRPLSCPLQPALVMTQRRYSALLQHPGLFPNFSQPKLCLVGERGWNQSSSRFTRLCFFIQPVPFFFFLHCWWKQLHGTTVGCVLVMTY